MPGHGERVHGYSTEALRKSIRSLGSSEYGILDVPSMQLYKMSVLQCSSRL